MGRYNNGYPSIEQLRKDGYKVRVSQRRWYYAGSDMALCHDMEADGFGLTNVLDFGGETEVTIVEPKHKNTFSGIARCSVTDTFNHARGIATAVGRAMKYGNKD